MVDTQDLKSWDWKRSCEFDSRSGHFYTTHLMPRNKNQKEAMKVRRTLHYFWHEIWQQKWAALLIVILTPIYIFFARFFLPFAAALFVDKVSPEVIAEGEVIKTLLPYVSVVVIAGIINATIFSYLRSHTHWKLQLKAMYNLSRRCFDTLAIQSMQFHNDRFSGSLVNQTNKFIHSFERFFDTIVFQILSLLSSYVIVFTILSIKAPLFALGMFVLVITYTGIAVFLFGRIAYLGRLQAEAETNRSGQLADSISNVLAVKSYGREEHERHRFANVSRSVVNTGTNLMRVFLRRTLYLNFVRVGMEALLILSVILGSIKFGFSAGTILLMITYGAQILDRMWDINNILRDLHNIFSNAYEMTNILDTPNAVQDKPGAKNIVFASGSEKLAGEVSFNNITFQHVGAKEPIFQNFSLHIKPGERIGLVGVSGSGKTTLTKLLLRFADVQSGEIVIDGQNIAEVSQNSLRENIAYVPQESSLFHRSLSQNIAYSKPDACEREIIKAAKLANIWEFIETLPAGLETLTGERGVKLSGGQRQRIIIARAILKNAPILVLDEATSALDSESEKLIQSALKELMYKRTSLVIAHRLSTIAELDRIIVLKAGRIVEDGPHKKLLKADGEYAKLWSHQTGAFLVEE